MDLVIAGAVETGAEIAVIIASLEKSVAYVTILRVPFTLLLIAHCKFGTLTNRYHHSTERGVCVKGENCEYEHLGRPLVVDEEGLNTLQSIVRGMSVPDEYATASLYANSHSFR